MHIVVNIVLLCLPHVQYFVCVVQTYTECAHLEDQSMKHVNVQRTNLIETYCMYNIPTLWKHNIAMLMMHVQRTIHNVQKTRSMRTCQSYVDTMHVHRTNPMGNDACAEE